MPWRGPSRLPRIDSQRSGAFGSRLIEWKRSRDSRLPWRRTPNPFHVLMAEILLQRTRVSLVERVYQELCVRFPTARSLSQLKQGELDRLTRGLGLHYRSRRLIRIAKVIDADGEFPNSSRKLLDLPGVGQYIANTVANLVFGEPVVMIDANVSRVMRRVFSADLGRQAYRRPSAYILVAGLVPEQSRAEFGTALLDFSLEVCRRSHPLCGSCPIASGCDAYGRVAILS